MSRAERFLPIILSFCLPALNIISNSYSQYSFDSFQVLPRYLVIVLFLLVLWYLNRYVLYRLDRTSSSISSYLILAFVDILYIGLFVLVNYNLPDDFSLVLSVPYWLVLTRLFVATSIFIVIQQVLRVSDQRESLKVQNLSLQAEKLKSELESMKQQVNPHFLFNSLNTLIDFIEDDKAKAILFARKFSNLYRIVLQSSKKDFVFLEDELSFLNDYWQLLKMRFEGRITMNVEIDKTKNKFLIPPLSLQLLVENAVKHNQASVSQPLHIHIYQSENRIIIENNIAPKPFVKTSEGLGLQNLQKRFSMLVRPIEYGAEDDVFRVVLPIIETTR